MHRPNCNRWLVLVMSTGYQRRRHASLHHASMLSPMIPAVPCILISCRCLYVMGVLALACLQYYKLTNSHSQISSYVFDVVRAGVPKMNLDDVFLEKEAIARSIREVRQVMHMSCNGLQGLSCQNCFRNTCGHTFVSWCVPFSAGAHQEHGYLWL